MLPPVSCKIGACRGRMAPAGHIVPLWPLCPAGSRNAGLARIAYQADG